MPNLFIAGEQLDSSPPLVAYKIMLLVEDKAEKKISIFDIMDEFCKERWFSYDNVVLGLIFLFATGLVDFKEPYVIKNVEN